MEYKFYLWELWQIFIKFLIKLCQSVQCSQFQWQVPHIWLVDVPDEIEVFKIIAHKHKKKKKLYVELQTLTQFYNSIKKQRSLFKAMLSCKQLKWQVESFVGKSKISIACALEDKFQHSYWTACSQGLAI